MRIDRSRVGGRNSAVFRVFLWLSLLAAAACGPVQVSDPSDADADDGGDGGDETPCTSDSECDDRIACTIDHCDGGICTHVPCTDCCPNGWECIEDFGCGQPPAPCTTDADCRDDTPCTLDRCVDADHCQHLPQNELCDDGEICLAALGCIPSPPTECDEDEDCDMGRPCLGEWECDPEFACQFRSLVDCDDDDECTDDDCDDDAGGCVYFIRDADEDGHGDAACGGDDCDDSNPDVSPSADEECGNGIDDDCDGDTDEDCCEDGPCTTECGSTGTTECLPDGTQGPCVPPDETCNAADDDCDGEVDEDFECTPPGLAETCTTTCGSTGSRECLTGCSWNICEAPAEECNGTDDDCDGDVDEGYACVAGSDESCTTMCGSTGTRTCLGDCSWDSCVPPAEVCNGADDDCDGTVDEGCCVEGEACITTCGTTGTRECLPDGTEGPCAPPPETCNGIDDDCDGDVDDGFDCTPGAHAACTTTCGSTGEQTCLATCAWDSCVPPSEECNGLDDDCDGTADEGYDCVAGTSGSCATGCGSTGTRDCLPSCRWDSCDPPAEVCNGSDDDCDGTCDEGHTCCAGTTRDCTALGWFSGTAVCEADCSGWNELGCTDCGNGSIDTGEECDGAALGGETCASIPGDFGGGTLRCAAGCVFDTSSCHRCGNGTIDAADGEECDGTELGGETCISLGMGFDGGTLGCTAGCMFDTSACTGFDPTGFYAVTPSFSYTCIYGLYTVAFSSLTFSDSGAVLVVDGAPCTMTGSSASTTRHIDVSCTLSGGCNETYSLVGDFTDDDHWSGTFEARFTPTSPGGCADCVTQTRAMSGAR